MLARPPSAFSSGAGVRNDAPNHTEFLDDRVLLFDSVGGGVRVYRYALRVVAAGRFALPPAQASCMYDPAYASIHGGGSMEVAK